VPVHQCRNQRRSRWACRLQDRLAPAASGKLSEYQNRRLKHRRDRQVAIVRWMSSTSRAYPSQVILTSACRCMASLGRPVVPEVQSQKQATPQWSHRRRHHRLPPAVRPSWSGCAIVGPGTEAHERGQSGASEVSAPISATLSPGRWRNGARMRVAAGRTVMAAARCDHSGVGPVLALYLRHHRAPKTSACTGRRREDHCEGYARGGARHPAARSPPVLPPDVSPPTVW